jgi:hypothetical protein
MRERPILFSAPMVRALLAGTKTQTRRVVKPQPVESWTRSANGPRSTRSWSWPLPDGQHVPVPDGMAVRCPHGPPGDRLWVREAWRSGRLTDGFAPREMTPHVVWYEADGPAPEATNGRARASMHMPRWASRITLEVTEVRVERLQDISHDDACAEGIESTRGGAGACIDRYRALWESINGHGSWQTNPWVWVVVFRRVQQ